MTGDEGRTAQPRILVVAPNWIGDALMAQPMLAQLLLKRPDAAIDMLAPAWVLPVAQRMPEVSNAIESPFGHGGLDLRGRWRLGRSLARHTYDQAIVLPNTWKSALAPFFADIGLRSGYVGESRYGLLNILHKLDRMNPPPMVERYLALAGRPGESLPEIPRTRLAASSANLTRVLADLSLPTPSGEQPVAVLCPGAEYGPAKRWPAENYAELAATLAEAGFSVWLMGSKADKPVAQAILEARPGCAVDLCGRTDLAGAIDLIAAAQVVVSNDSGLMHIAAALDRPLVALFGSSSPTHTPPRSEKARVEYLAIECSPCFARVCPLGHFRCMRELSPGRIIGATLAASGTRSLVR
jgi:heptosyltransferase-2